MLGKHKPLRDGAEAKAVVTSVNLYQEGMRGNWGTGFTYDVGLRVHFDDHTTEDVVRRIGGMAGTDLKFTVGDIVPVRYDPRNRDKIELDEDSLRAEQQRAREAAQRSVDTHNERAVRDAEAKLAENHRGEGAGLAPLDPELQELMDLEEAERQTGAARADQSSGGSQARLDRLQQLAYLHDQGILTDAEVAVEKARILNES